MSVEFSKDVIYLRFTERSYIYSYAYTIARDQPIAEGLKKVYNVHASRETLQR